MSDFLFFQSNIRDGARELDTEESRHCIRVLRKRSGDAIRITDGKGNFYEAVITDPNPAACGFSIISETPDTTPKALAHIAISPTKNADRIEWFVEKATEIGVDRITLMQCHHTERGHVKTERLRKVAISAMKQSMKAFLPEITSGLLPFSDVVKSVPESARFIAYVDAEHSLHLKDAIQRGVATCVLIGPEGDFSPDEIGLALEHGFQPVSLGPSRLRTETAGMVACHIIQLGGLADQ